MGNVKKGNLLTKLENGVVAMLVKARSQNVVVWISPEDVEVVRAFTWGIGNAGHVVTHARPGNRTLYLSHLIAQPPARRRVCFRDGDIHNHTRENLWWRGMDTEKGSR
jgi:hypothetical protein